MFGTKSQSLLNWVSQPLDWVLPTRYSRHSLVLPIWLRAAAVTGTRFIKASFSALGTCRRTIEDEPMATRNTGHDDENSSYTALL